MSIKEFKSLNQITGEDFAEKLEQLAANLRSGEKKITDFMVIFSHSGAVELLHQANLCEAFYMLEFARAHFIRKSQFTE